MGITGRIFLQPPDGLSGQRGLGARNLSLAPPLTLPPPASLFSLCLRFPRYETRINICLRDEGVVRINWLVLQEVFEDERGSLQMLSKLIMCLVLMSQVKPVGVAGD